jgi:choice-of-anchor B domain-containing protein
VVRRTIIPAILLVLVASGGTVRASVAPPTEPPIQPPGPRDGKAIADWNPALARPSSAGAAQAAVVPCTAGSAGGFPCRNVDLMARLPLASMGGGSGSGGWGWTDPQTGREYAIAGRSNGVSFVDVTDPANPVYLGNMPPATGNSSWREVNVYNNTAYVTSEAAGSGLQIFDLTRLRNVPNPPITFNADARNTSFGHAHTVSVNYDTGLVYADGSDTCSGGPRMFDARANRLNPPFVGCVSGDGYTHDSQAVLYRGPDTRFQGREIMFNSNEDTLTLYDITTRSSPTQLSRKTYSGRGYVHQGWLTPDHRFFFLNDELDERNAGHNTRSYVWDMSNLTNPVLLGFYTGPTSAIDHNEFTKGNFVFQSNYTAGLRILNTTNAANPASITEAAFFDVHPANNNAAFNGTWTNYPYFRLQHRGRAVRGTAQPERRAAADRGVL